MTEANFPAPEIQIEAAVEALLFVADRPVTVNQLADSLGKTAGEIDEALRHLDERYSDQGGLSLQRHEGRYQLTTAPQMAGIVEKFLGLEATARLSRAALETLAIIAYRQPITRPGIDAIRGVSSDGVLKSLLSKGLVQEVGRTEGPGRPVLFGTTQEFLQHFGLKYLEEMPPFSFEEPTETESTGSKLLKD